MLPIDKREIIGRYIKAYNSFDIDSMLALLHPDVRFKNLSNGEINAQAIGKSEFESLARQSATLFKKRTQTIKSLEITGDKATVEVDFIAILAKALSDNLQAGDKLIVQGKSEFIFKDNLILSIVDESQKLHQLWE
jgi:SnoaL-like domain